MPYPSVKTGYVGNLGFHRAWFQLRAFGYHYVLQMSPQRACETPCHRDDRDAPRGGGASSPGSAPVESLRQATVGLVAQPCPRHLDQQGTHPPVALFAESEQFQRETRRPCFANSFQACQIIASLARVPARSPAASSRQRRVAAPLSACRSHSPSSRSRSSGGSGEPP